MKKELIVIKNYSNGLINTPQAEFELGVDMPIGSLVAYDKTTDSLVLATNVASGSKRAIGFVYKASAQPWGAGFTFDKKAILNKGELLHLYRRATLTIPDLVTEQNKGTVKIGDPVYMGKDGTYTLKKSTTTDEMIQVVGFLVDKEECIVNLFLWDEGRKVGVTVLYDENDPMTAMSYVEGVE